MRTLQDDECEMCYWGIHDKDSCKFTKTTVIEKLKNIIPDGKKIDLVYFERPNGTIDITITVKELK